MFRTHALTTTAALALAMLLALTGCGGDGGSDVGSETHFLEYCDEDLDCTLGGGSLECLCGVCTKACDTDGACTDLTTAATCLELSEYPGCQGVNVPRVCGVRCDDGTLCPEGTRCYGSLCLGAAPEPTLSATCADGASCVLCDYPVAPQDASECYCPSCEGAALSAEQCADNARAWQETCAADVTACAAVGTVCPASVRASCHNAQCARSELEEVTPGCVVDRWTSLPGASITPTPTRCAVSLAELADGWTMPYGVTFAHPIRQVITEGADGPACAPDGARFVVTELISDGGRRFCGECATPGLQLTCEPDAGNAVDIAPMSLSRELSWDGRGGGASWPDDLRTSLGPGTYRVTLKARGVVDHISDGDVPFEVGASVQLVVTEE